MNLHGIVSGAIGAVNPLVPITVRVSIPPVTNPDGSLTPQYDDPVCVIAQVQQLTTRDLRQVEALNLQGSMRKVYLNGQIDGIVRFSQKGGDLVTMADGTVWLTTTIVETWPDWTAAVVVLQNQS